MTTPRKFRYEFPPMEPHFVEAPSPKAVIAFIKRTYPHNYDEVLPTIVEIPMWPEFWKVLDPDGRVVPRNQRPENKPQ
jgi:hypothetical protein